MQFIPFILLIIPTSFVLSAFLTTYCPPLPQCMMAILLVILLVLINRRLPLLLRSVFLTPKLRLPLCFAAIGFVVTATLIFMDWLFSMSSVPAVITALLNIDLPILVFLLVFVLTGRGSGWDWRHQFALVSGGLGFFIFLGPIQEMDSSRVEVTTVMTLTAILALMRLFWINIHKEKAV